MNTANRENLYIFGTMGQFATLYGRTGSHLSVPSHRNQPLVNRPRNRIMAYQHILDNRTHTVADYLRKSLQSADAFRLVSAYFSIYGYAQLEDALEHRRRSSVSLR